MCGYEICIQFGTYKELINHWCKCKLRYINNHTNSLTRGSVEQFNAENTFSINSDVLLHDGEPIHPCLPKSYCNNCL